MQPLGNHAPGAQARLGTTLSGKWRLDEVLGVGGVATVYSVTHRNQSRAALKLLHVEQAQNPTVRERFVHEGYAANSIDHPGVVRVIDDDTSEEGLPYLVMELLDGETLENRAYRRGDSLPAGDVLALMDQLLDVLIVAHEKRIIHRDIKPDNLFLTREGRLKVLDFGIARLTQAVPNRDVTAVGTLLGTPSFMPPEQARSRWEEVDAQSDLYSVGATMFALLSGKLVREAETLTEQLALAIHEPAPKLSSVDKTIDLQVCALVDKALAYDKRNRFLDARTMQREVRRLRELLPAPLTSSVSPAPESRRTPRVNSPEVPTLLESGRVALAPTRESKPITIAIERRVATALILLLLVAAGGLVWFLIRPTPSPVEGTRGVATAVALLPPPGNVEPTPPAPSREQPTAEPPLTEPPTAAHRATPPTARPAASSNVRPAPSSSAVAPASPPPLPVSPAKSSDPFSNRY